MSRTKCNAKSKRTGQQCGAWPVTGSEKCYHHGGKTPRGFDLPQTTTGRWSKDLPTRLAGRYQAALEDGKLLELRNELAVIDTRLGEILTGLDTGEAGELWRALQHAGAAFRAAKGDAVKAGEALSLLLSLVEKGAAEWMRWDDVFKTIERRARIAESERRRLVEAKQMISSEQLGTLIGALVAAIRQHVKDPVALRGVSADLNRLLSAGQPVAEA